MSTREGISPEYAEVQSPVAPCTAGPTAPHRSSAPRMLRQIADADGASQDALRVDDRQAAGKCNKSLGSEPPGCDRLPICPVGMPKKTVVFAFLMAISMLPAHASWEAFRF